MTLIEVKLLRRVFTVKQKREMITKLTAAMEAMNRESDDHAIWVLIEEAGPWGLAGEPINASTLRSLVMTECPMFARERQRRSNKPSL